MSGSLFNETTPTLQLLDVQSVIPLTFAEIESVAATDAQQPTLAPYSTPALQVLDVQSVIPLAFLEPDAVGTVDAQLRTTPPSPAVALLDVPRLHNVTWQQLSEYNNQPALKTALEEGVRAAAKTFERLHNDAVLHTVIRSVPPLFLPQLADSGFVCFSSVLHKKCAWQPAKWVTVDYIMNDDVWAVHVFESTRCPVRFVTLRTGPH